MTKIRTLGIREQAAWLRSRHAGFQCDVTGGLLTCRGAIRPGPMSATYEFILEYRTGRWPKVYVPGDQLKPREPGGKIPHTYGPTEPCLFYPGRGGVVFGYEAVSYRRAMAVAVAQFL